MAQGIIFQHFPLFLLYYQYEFHEFFVVFLSCLVFIWVKQVQSVVVLKRKMGGWFLLWLTTSVIVDDAHCVFRELTSTAPVFFSLFSSKEQVQYDCFSLPNGTG